MELDQLAGLPDLLTDVPDPWSLPAGLEDRTVSAVEAAAQGIDSGSGTGTAGELTTIAPITAARRRSRGPRGPQRLLIAAAAAAAVIVAGVATLSSLRTSTPAPVTTLRLIAANGGPAHGNATARTPPGGLTIDMTVDGVGADPQAHDLHLLAGRRR